MSVNVIFCIVTAGGHRLMKFFSSVSCGDTNFRKFCGIMTGGLPSQGKQQLAGNELLAVMQRVCINVIKLSIIEYMFVVWLRWKPNFLLIFLKNHLTIRQFRAA